MHFTEKNIHPTTKATKLTENYKVHELKREELPESGSKSISIHSTTKPTNATTNADVTAQLNTVNGNSNFRDELNTFLTEFIAIFNQPITRALRH